VASKPFGSSKTKILSKDRIFVLDYILRAVLPLFLFSQTDKTELLTTRSRLRTNVSYPKIKGTSSILIDFVPFNFIHRYNQDKVYSLWKRLLLWLFVMMSFCILHVCKNLCDTFRLMELHNIRH